MFKVLGACLIGSSAWGWGSLGHRTTGQVAEAYLTPQARQAVQSLLKGASLADVANWADSVRSDPNYKHLSWYHFEKLPDNMRYLDHLGHLPPDLRMKGGVLQAILVAQATLEDPQQNLASKEIALKSLVHFIGDMHQPLHSGRPEDRGGNNISVNWFGQETNLHSVWDSAMIITGRADLFRDLPVGADYSVVYARWLMQKFQRSFPPRESIGNSEAWLAESVRLRDAAYDSRLQTNQRAYEVANIETIDRRVHASGLRIAETINRLFSRAPMPPADRNLYGQIERVLGRLTDIIVLGPKSSAPARPGTEAYH